MTLTPFRSRHFPISAALLIVTMVAGCAHRDDFPMHNPNTGKNVTCHSGEYLFEEGFPQLKIAVVCIHACEKYGFRQFTGNPYADASHPESPPEDLKQYIPKECLP